MIGTNIGNRMRFKRMTQQELAEKAGISQASLSAIINGKSGAKAETLSAIASALGCTVAALKVEPSEPRECPRCGSRSISEWRNHGKESCRIRCNYCELDTGEQNSRAKALSVFYSFKNAEPRRAPSDVYVLPRTELLDASCFDGDDVRPVWFENRGLFIVPALLRCGIAERELELVKVVWFGSGAKSFMLEQYGKWWRVWNGKASEAKSDATPWAE